MRRIFWLSLVLVIIFVAVFLVKDHFKISPTTSYKQITKSENIPVLILPHFDFAKEKRLEFLKTISQKISPKKIIVVSVNHYNQGNADILTTDRTWQLKDLSLPINQPLLNDLTKGEDKLVESSEEAFVNEHGIKNILPDLATFFPKAEYLPIIIKDKTPKDKIEQLIKHLSSSCDGCLLVASIDFSHYLPNSLAQIHDQMSLSALINLDEEKGWSAETDSPQGLFLAVQWAEVFKAEKFSLFYHSNSGDQSKSDDLETTSYILGYYTDSNLASKTREKSSTFVIAGDLMLDRGVYHQFKEKGLNHVFDNFGSRVFWGTDLALVNLEGPISPEPIIDDSTPGNLVFNFPPETTEVLKFLHLNAVSLANNHTLNAGQKGFEATKNALAAAGIKSIGKENSFDEKSILRIEGKIPLSIIALNQLASPEQKQIKEAIKKEKSAGYFVIVFPHWGNEYQKVYSNSQVALAHSWIEAGGDLVVGSHPHVVQDFEIYQNRPIIYSLGNFVFDQTFSKETQEGLIVAGIVKSESIELTFLPIELNRLMPQLMQGEEKEAKIKTILDIDKAQSFTKVRSDTLKMER